MEVSFSDAKVRCIKDYMKRSLREYQDHFIFQVGTNNLGSQCQPGLVAKTIMYATAALKIGKHDVAISNIIV